MNTTDSNGDEIVAALSKVPGFCNVRFILLFGSVAEGRAGPASDIDLAIYYEGDQEEASLFRFQCLTALGSFRYDVTIFQQLPLYIRIRTLRGKVGYCPDPSFLYDVAWDTIKEYNAFKHRLDDYTGEKALS